MQKIKLGELVGSVEALKELSTVKFPIKVSYQISRLLTEVERELKIVDEKRNALIKEYGKEDMDGKVSILKEDKENLDKFLKEFDEYLTLEVELQFANKLKLDDLGDVKVSPASLVSWLFE